MRGPGRDRRNRWISLGVVLAAISLGAWYLNRSGARQRAAIEGIENLGGVVRQKWVSERAGWLLQHGPQSPVLAQSFMRPFAVDVTGETLRPEQQPFGDAELQRLIVHLSELPDVEMLNLFYLPITDAGLSGIGSLNVSGIGIMNCPVRDDCVPQLAQLGCTEYWLVGTEMTPAGCRKLQAALPDSRIFFDSDGDPTYEELQAYQQAQSFGF